MLPAHSMLVMAMVVLRCWHDHWRLWRVLVHRCGLHMHRAAHACFVMARYQARHLQGLGFVKLHHQLTPLPSWHADGRTCAVAMPVAVACALLHF